jgi:SAM-dependent methyltransferase
MTARVDRDIFRLAPGMEPSVLQMIADRLEYRGSDDGFTRLSQAYFDRLPFDSAKRVLALGCGTGVEVRALRRRISPDTVIVGVDHSAALVDVATRLTADEGLAHNVTYDAGDAHHLPYDDGEFDIVTMQTLVSHVNDPFEVLREARRVVRPTGTVAIFDGDYASLTFGYPDHELAEMIEAKLRLVFVANPRIMRDLPRLLPAAGLALVDAQSAVYADIGTGGFWANAAEAYGAVLARADLLPPEVVEKWRALQAESARDGTFFGSSAYYTYIARRPD